jgi:hypothetical protein
LVGFSGVSIGNIGMMFLGIAGVAMAIFLYFAIDKRELDIKTINVDIKNFKNLFQIELYVVCMLHELERLV